MNPDSIPIELRAETPEDQRSIWHVNAETFDQRNEADLVNALRDSGDLFASSVALIGSRVVGHAALSIGSIGQRRLLVLAPVAVVPDLQGRGIGKSVVSHVLTAAGNSPVTVFGDPEFYSRFGFQAAEPFGVAAPFSVDPRALQLLNAKTVPAGTLTYAAPFPDL
jgi:predicted N-acetyltransferase YhbS